MIYFDNAATTFPKPKEVYEGITYAMTHYSFNAGRGTYEVANKTHKMIYETRELIGKYAHANSDNVVFTSSATESINMILYGLNLSETDCVLVSPFEHNAVFRALINYKIKYYLIPFDKNTWKIDRSSLNNLLVIKKPKAIIISHLSNVTGYELPYKEIFSIGKEHNTINVLDAAQSFGVYDIDKKNIDFIIFAGHKSLYAMFGIAGFINYFDYKLRLLIAGGTGSDSLNLSMPSNTPMRYEAGSINAVGVYSLNVALDYLINNNPVALLDYLTNYLICELEKNEKIVLYLPISKKVHGIVSFNVKGYLANEVGEILANDFDICVRTGYHCAPAIHDFIGSRDFGGTVRISLGMFNKIEEIDELVKVIKEL